jgi:phage gp36-like protein
LPARATLSDLGSLGLPGQLLAGLPAVQQQQALDSASAKVDSYLGAHFTLPLTAYGQDIIEAEVNLASYQLLVARGFNPEAGPDKAIKERYDETVKWLQGIAEGDLVPNVADSSSGGAVGGPFVATSAQRGWNGTPGIGSGFWDPNAWDFTG